MRGIAFRRVPPPIQVVLFLSLFAIGQLQRKVSGAYDPTSDRFCDPTIDCILPRDAVVVAILVSLPAFVVPMPFSAIPVIDQHLEVQALACSLVVFFFWYFVGSLLDRTLGMLPQLPKRIPGKLVQGGDLLGLLVCVLIGLSSLNLWFRGGLYSPRHDIIPLSVLLWSAVGAAFFAARIGSWHALKKAEKQAEVS
jgi:prepilin signal peptidase PulO-like enzyme (type II secretory pathway)